jgi:hypothetical protein
MQACQKRFGEVVLAGKRYDHDVVIAAGKIDKRRKKPSKQYRDRYGHTPLSAAENIPWGAEGQELIIGTGFHGSLPVMPEIEQEAKRRGVTVQAMPTQAACGLLEEMDSRDVFAVLHVTC